MCSVEAELSPALTVPWHEGDALSSSTITSPSAASLPARSIHPLSRSLCMSCSPSQSCCDSSGSRHEARGWQGARAAPGPWSQPVWPGCSLLSSPLLSWLGTSTSRWRERKKCSCGEAAADAAEHLCLPGKPLPLPIACQRLQVREHFVQNWIALSGQITLCQSQLSPTQPLRGSPVVAPGECPFDAAVLSARSNSGITGSCSLAPGTHW